MAYALLETSGSFRLNTLPSTPNPLPLQGPKIQGLHENTRTTTKYKNQLQRKYTKNMQSQWHNKLAVKCLE